MANAFIHSKSSAKIFGGIPEDYMAIHEKMDSSKAYFPSAAHRILTHNTFWIHEVMIPLFGYMYTRPSDRIQVCTKDICERHLLEDFSMPQCKIIWN